MNSESLESVLSEQLLAQGAKRTFSFDYHGEKVWVKQPEQGEANF